MAQNAAPFSAIGRTVFIKSFAKTNITQAELNDLVKAVQLTSTITAIGAFTAGTSDVVNMIIEGADVSEVAGFDVSDVAF
jgi:NCAIR mutase (PurE)-related protein